MMLSMIDIFKKHFIKLFSLFICIENFFQIFLKIFTQFFNEDEFQHTHIAWNQNQGLTLYKDFFEHHGPLYSLLNKYIFSLLENPASFDTLILLRIISFFTALVIVFLVYLVAKNYNQDNSNFAYITIAVFSLWTSTQMTLLQIRPDNIQTVFMLLGFLMLFIGFKKGAIVSNLLSGFCFALMLITNFKTLIIAIPLLIFLLLYIANKKDFTLVKSFSYLTLGLVSCLAITSFYFIKIDALKDLLHYNFLYNIEIIKIRVISKTAIASMVYSFIETNLVLSIMVIIGCFYKAKSNFKKILIIGSIIAALVPCIKGFHIHYYIIFLPFCSILVANCFEFLLKKDSKPWKIFFYILISYLLINNFIYRDNTIDHELFIEQKSLINYVLENHGRNEKAYTDGNKCPVYVFNIDQDTYCWSDLEYTNDLNAITFLAAEREPSKSFVKRVPGFVKLEIDGKASCAYVNKSKLPKNKISKEKL
jgi:hypothetical protein